MTLMRPHPHRLPTLAPPGALLKRAAGLAHLMRRSVNDGREPNYLAMIRELPCLSCGMEPAGEAAHVRYNSGAHGKHNGLGKKPDPKWCVPLCGGCHREDRGALHRLGEVVFWTLLGINPLLVCTRLYAAKGDIVRMRAVILLAIAERQR